MWKIDPKHLFDPTFTSMEPAEVLVDFEGPKMFTFLQGDEIYFACISDEDYDAGVYRFMAVLTSKMEIEALKIGVYSIDEVLNHRPLWLVDCSFDLTVLQSVKTKGLQSVPEDFRPVSGILLYPHLKRPAKKSYQKSITADSALAALKDIQLQNNRFLEQINIPTLINLSSTFRHASAVYNVMKDRIFDLHINEHLNQSDSQRSYKNMTTYHNEETFSNKVQAVHSVHEKPAIYSQALTQKHDTSALQPSAKRFSLLRKSAEIKIKKFSSITNA